MTGWVRNPENHRLVRSEPDLDLESEPQPKLKLEEMAQERTLGEIYYSPRTALPSCFTIPDLGPNMTFKL